MNARSEAAALASKLVGYSPLSENISAAFPCEICTHQHTRWVGGQQHASFLTPDVFCVTITKTNADEKQIFASAPFMTYQWVRKGGEAD